MEKKRNGDGFNMNFIWNLNCLFEMLVPLQDYFRPQVIL